MKASDSSVWTQVCQCAKDVEIFYLCRTELLVDQNLTKQRLKVMPKIEMRRNSFIFLNIKILPSIFFSSGIVSVFLCCVDAKACTKLL